MKSFLKSAALAATLVFAGNAMAADAQPAKAASYTVTLKDNQFSPKDLVVPANEKFELIVKNESDKAAEFESDDLSREKVVAAKSEIKLNVGPLKAGSYSYFNEYHEATKGTITAK